MRIQWYFCCCCDLNQTFQTCNFLLTWYEFDLPHQRTTPCIQPLNICWRLGTKFVIWEGIEVSHVRLPRINHKERETVGEWLKNIIGHIWFYSQLYEVPYKSTTYWKCSWNFVFETIWFCQYFSSYLLMNVLNFVGVPWKKKSKQIIQKGSFEFFCFVTTEKRKLFFLQ